MAIEEVYPQLRTAFLSSAGVQNLHKMSIAQADAQLSKSSTTPRAVLVWLNNHNSLAPISPPAVDPVPIAVPAAPEPVPALKRLESSIGADATMAGADGVSGMAEGGGGGGEDEGSMNAMSDEQGGADSGRSTVSVRPMVVGVLQAAALLCHNYLACNTHDATLPRCAAGACISKSCMISLCAFTCALLQALVFHPRLILEIN